MGYCDKHKETTHFKFLIKPRSPVWARLTWHSSSNMFLIFQTNSDFEVPILGVRTAIWVSSLMYLPQTLWLYVINGTLQPGSCFQSFIVPHIALWVWPCILSRRSLLFCALIKWGNNSITLQSRNSQLQYYSNTTDIGGQIILGEGGWPMHCGMFGSTPDRYPLDVRSSHSPFTILWQPKRCPARHCPMTPKSKIDPGWRPLPCRIVLKRECIICIMPRPVWVHSKPPLWIVIIICKTLW